MFLSFSALFQHDEHVFLFRRVHAMSWMFAYNAKHDETLIAGKCNVCNCMCITKLPRMTSRGGNLQVELNL